MLILLSMLQQSLLQQRLEIDFCIVTVLLIVSGIKFSIESLVKVLHALPSS